MPSLDAYDDRYVAFLDVLGFADLIRRIQADESVFAHVIETLRMVDATRLNLDVPMQDSLGTAPASAEQSAQILEVSSFSDSIIVSSCISFVGIRAILAQVASICVGLLRIGVLCRGGIERGKLYHRDDVVFGTALLDAIQLEREVAKYSRITIGDRFLKDVGIAFGDGWETLFPQDLDGLCFFDFLSQKDFMEFVFRDDRGLNDYERTKEGLAVVRKKLNEGLPRPEASSKFSKWYWMAAHFNAAMERLQAKYPTGHDLQVTPIPIPEWTSRQLR